MCSNYMWAFARRLNSSAKESRKSAKKRAQKIVQKWTARTLENTKNVFLGRGRVGAFAERPSGPVMR
jgi:hypothetical protein